MVKIRRKKTLPCVSFSFQYIWSYIVIYGDTKKKKKKKKKNAIMMENVPFDMRLICSDQSSPSKTEQTKEIEIEQTNEMGLQQKRSQ